MFMKPSNVTNRFGAALVLFLLCAASAMAGSSKLPASMRKVVLEQIDSGGFRWKVVEVPVPTLGDRD